MGEGIFVLKVDVFIFYGYIYGCWLVFLVIGMNVYQWELEKKCVGVYCEDSQDDLVLFRVNLLGYFIFKVLCVFFLECYMGVFKDIRSFFLI